MKEPELINIAGFDYENDLNSKASVKFTYGFYGSKGGSSFTFDSV
jgi:hypothetical protein